MRTIFIILTFLSLHSCNTVPLSSAPKSYIVEHVEKDKFDENYSYYYMRSIITGHYIMTLEYYSNMAIKGDTVMIKEFTDGVHFIKNSRYINK